MNSKLNNEIAWPYEQRKMHFLYVEILKSYKKRLIHSWSRNPHLSPFESEEKIDRFIEVTILLFQGIKYYYNRASKMYDKVVKERATGIKKIMNEAPNY